MKLMTLCAFVLCLHVTATAQQEKTFNDTAFLQPVEVSVVKQTDKDPFAKTNLTKEDIRQKNTGQDLPFILNNTPSVVVNSDAGNGIGYTGIRIRGTDGTRINVTLNGIPYNDAESLGTYFVDLPDIASSAGSIQVQRGVGTSANGAGSFGGSINVSTNELNTTRNLELNSSAGSYGSFKNTLLFNSGIFHKHFLVDARMSNIRSDGYIDRAAVRLASYYISTAYVKEHDLLRINIFTGKEKTYQAWYGVNETALDTNRRFNPAGMEKPGTPYDNETDNYTQTHYQLFYDHKFRASLKSNIALFFTKGKGYYEQYKADQDLMDYGFPAIVNTDLVRRLWLDNNLYGTIFSLQYEKQHTQVIFGGGYNRYEGKHYGNIVWTKESAAIPSGYHFYDNDAYKNDLSVYTKWTQTLCTHVQTFVDLQVRNINYTINGFRYNPDLKIDRNFFFFNPKAGLSWSKNNYKLYASYARAVKEPNRDDFEAAPDQLPKAEKLNDYEAGLEYKKQDLHAGVNFYYMSYLDQLVLTGKINDVGAYTRTNIPESYRAGAEFFAGVKLNRILSFSGNLTVSKNKIKNFTEYIDDYDAGGQKAKLYTKSDISFSPDLISSFTVNIIPVKKALLSFTGKYVGEQFLDNTSDNKRRLHPYYTQEVRAGYTWEGMKVKRVDLFVQVNNIFSKLYTPNGYTFSYIYGGEKTTENFYFPMAPVNFIVGLNIKL